MLTTTLVFNEGDANFRYVGDWWTGGAWAAGNGHSGTLSGTNDPNASASFTFPVAATAFRFFGMKHRHGGLFGICVGCDPYNPSFQEVDGFNATDNGDNGPSLLHSQAFTSPSTHSIILRNRNDLRGIPIGNSQLTIARFELDVPIPQNEITLTSTFLLAPTSIVTPTVAGAIPATQSSPAATTLPTSQPETMSGIPATLTPATTTRASSLVTPGSSISSVFRSSLSSVKSSATSQLSQSQSASASLPTSTVTARTSVTDSPSSSASIAQMTSPSKPTPIGGVIGSLLGGLAAIAILITLITWFKMKKKFTSLVTTARPFHAPEMSTITFEPTTTSTTVSTGPTGNWAIGYGPRSSEKRNRYHPQAPTSSNSSSTAPSPGPSSSRARHRGGLTLPDTIRIVHSSKSISNSNTPSSGANSDSFRRELDAGPVPQQLMSDENGGNLIILPPAYGQFFSAHVL